MSSRTRPFLCVCGRCGLISALLRWQRRGGIAGVIVGRHLGATRRPPRARRRLRALQVQANRGTRRDRGQRRGPRQRQSVLGDWRLARVVDDQGSARSSRRCAEDTAAEGHRSDDGRDHESDNAAAESIWAGLGGPGAAAHKVDVVLRQSRRPDRRAVAEARPEFSAFGQTDWLAGEPARGSSRQPCATRSNAPIFALMGRVEPDQRWGVGIIPSSRFKGGWGPSPSGGYLVRQMGVLRRSERNDRRRPCRTTLSREHSTTARRISPRWRSWLTAHLGELPAGQCAHHK